MVRFENVGLRYGLGPEVLRDLNFNIEPQSFQFLTGPSGAGKTSLVQAGLLTRLRLDAHVVVYGPGSKPLSGLIDALLDSDEERQKWQAEIAAHPGKLAALNAYCRLSYLRLARRVMIRHRSMAKVPDPCKHHRQSVLVGRGDRLCVVD